MLKLQYGVTLCACLLCCPAFSQELIHGTVIEKETHEPVIGATIAVEGRKAVAAVTDATGRFTLKDATGKTIRISYIGYTTLSAKATDNAIYRLQAEVNNIDEVVVTAQESRSPGSASIIKRHAMEHLQPSSFSDILELLPGGRATDPQLTSPNSIHLREATPSSSANYATSALGTGFVVDGAPISTNANMQFLSGAWETAATGRDFTNSGVDMRSLSTDDIASVEVVRGIPSVAYGDLTSGLVKIERKRGGNGLSARLKTDMSSKLFYLAKDMEWGNTTLNISADYLDAKNDPRNTLENYSRLTLSVRLGHRWKRRNLTFDWRNNADFTGSFDREKVDPDLNYGQVDKYKSSYNRMAFSSIFELQNRRHGWFRSAGATLSASYQHDVISRTRLVQLSRTTVAATTLSTGESDGVILPYSYTATQKADGKPLNIFLKLHAKFQVPSRAISNTLFTGVEWNMDKNYGGGQLFNPLLPLYPGISTRLRKLSVIPANHTLSAYVEENVKLPLGAHLLELVAGVRASELLNLPSDYTMHGKVYLDPRANIGWTLPGFRVAGRPAFVRLAAGIGRHTKNPTMDQLFPSPLYLDISELNYYHANADYRRVYLMTYVIDPTNKQLHAARNLKWELSTDFNVGENRLSITFFRENMRSGFRSNTIYAPYQYKSYDTSGIDASTLTAPPDVATLPYTMTQELYGHSETTNGSQTLKQGIEYTLSTRRWQQLHTRLTITGAWFRTTYRNSQVVMYRPGVTLSNKQLQYVGIYRDNDGVVNQMANTNFTADTDLPKLKLGFSISAQCLWFTSSQRLPLSNTPTQYMDADGNLHEWQESDATDAERQWLVRTHTDSEYQKYTVPFAMNLNFKVTKKLMADRLSVAMFCNKIWDYTPDYKSNGATIRRHVNPYFGLEMNIKL